MIAHPAVSTGAHPDRQPLLARKRDSPRYVVLAAGHHDDRRKALGLDRVPDSAPTSRLIAIVTRTKNRSIELSHADTRSPPNGMRANLDASACEAIPESSSGHRPAIGILRRS